MNENIDIKTIWDLTDLYENEHDPKIELDFEEVKNDYEAFVKKWVSRNDYLSDAKVLLELLNESEVLSRKHIETGGKPWYYFWLRRQLDDKDQLVKQKFNQLDEVSLQIDNKLLFMSLNLSKIPEAKQKEFLSNDSLSEYHHFLEKLFLTGKYTLSEKEEQLVNIFTKPGYVNWMDVVSEFLSKEEAKVFVDENKKEIQTLDQLFSLFKSPIKKVRDGAAKRAYEILNKHADLATAEMNSILSFNDSLKSLKKFERVDSPRHLNDDISSSVVDALIEAVNSNGKQALRLRSLRAKIMCVTKLKSYERSVELGKSTKKISVKESINIVDKALSNLDRDFGNLFRTMLTSGRIDFLPRKGKTSGGFCVSFSNTSSVYILVNHTNILRDVTTLAHEMGHALNFELSKKQKNVNYDVPLSTAEVASTFMEDFVFEELLKTASEEDKLYLLIKKLDEYIGTIHTQVSLYNFEKRMHEQFSVKKYLSKEEISSLFEEEINKMDRDVIDVVEGSKHSWVAWPHIRSPFYVYSYASGILISLSMQQKVKDDPKFIEKVKTFLEAGSSKSPRDIFNEMGIDITDKKFWSEGLKKVDLLLDEAEELAKKLGKI